MTTIELKAPCKVNYRLDVLRRRADGYHDLRMIMQRVDLCDTITLSLSDIPGIRVTCGRDGVPDGPGNIAWRAADALLSRSHGRWGIDITIQKNIPVAAGLGGGSSDAATVLMGVNELLELGLSDQDLMAIGVTLGADVPFFIFKKTAFAEGIGEIFTPLDAVPTAWLLLVNPRVPVSTAWVYQNLELTNREAISIVPPSYDSIPELCAILVNDLEAVTIAKYPVIREIKERMLREGAAGALMSGSGPTVFGIFEEEETARSCAGKLAAEHDWFYAVVKTL
jgi:4-diphosphocytidyl-2-C-methyl-D-erythritol kinase